MKIIEKLKSFYLEKLLIPYYNVFCPKLYTSIYDTPAYIWEEFHDKKDVNILLDLIKKPSLKDLSSLINMFYISLKNEKWLYSEKITNLYRKLYEEIIDNFPPKEYIKDIKVRYEIAMLRHDAAIFGHRIKETIADMKEAELEEKNKQAELKVNLFYQNCADMQKPHNLNIYIDTRKITIFEYRNNLVALSSKNGTK